MIIQSSNFHTYLWIQYIITNNRKKQLKDHHKITINLTKWYIRWKRLNQFSILRPHKRKLLRVMAHIIYARVYLWIIRMWIQRNSLKHVGTFVFTPFTCSFLLCQLVEILWIPWFDLNCIRPSPVGGRKSLSWN